MSFDIEIKNSKILYEHLKLMYGFDLQFAIRDYSRLLKTIKSNTVRYPLFDFEKPYY